MYLSTGVLNANGLRLSSYKVGRHVGLSIVGSGAFVYEVCGYFLMIQGERAPCFFSSVYLTINSHVDRASYPGANSIKLSRMKSGIRFCID